MKQMTAVRTTLCSLFTALVAIGALLRILLPNFDYFTLQLFLVLMVGMLLGAHLGILSAVLYVLIGLLGIPIFAAGGGVPYVLCLSFELLLGFIVTAFCSNRIMQRGQRKWEVCLLVILAGSSVTYGTGLAYKYVTLNYYTGTEISSSLLLSSYFPLDLPEDILCNILMAYVALCFPVAVYHGIRQEGVYARQIQK